MRGELRWKLHAAQLKIYNLVKNLPPSQREALVFCARGFGKSFLEVVLALEDCLQNPGVQVAIIGPSIKQAKKIVTPLLKLIIADAPEGLIRPHISTDTWICSNGSVLTIAGYDTAAEALRGQTLFNIYLEETGFSTNVDIEDYTYLLYSVLMPALRSRTGARMMHFTTPSRIVDHPLHVETLPKCKMAGAFYKFTIEDNPRLTREQIDQEIKTMGGLDSIAVQRELFCEIKRDDSITAVTTFGEERHVATIEPSHDLKWIIAGDTGYTKDLTVYLRGGYDHNLGKVVIRHEKAYKPDETSTSEIALDILKDWPINGTTVVADAFIDTRRIMAALGFSAGEPKKDQFEPTINFIRNEFYNDRVVIHPDCTLLVETLRSAIFNKKRSDFQRTASLGHADALMALVYLLRSVDRITDLRPRPDPMKFYDATPKNTQADRIRKMFG
ncbi:MAG: terminase family protein [Pseudobdellovibrionaceae bacterium]|nr:terminase family protein [Pseudobdellovibrionaceae bacterium]